MSSVNNNCSCNLSWCNQETKKPEKAARRSSLRCVSESLTVPQKPQKPQSLKRSVTPIQSREEIEKIFNVKLS